MSSSSKQTKQSKKGGYEKKMVDGKLNPKYVDMAEVDKPIAGQSFVCVSFVSPETILKQKNIFFFEEFLKTWQFDKSMEKFIQFVNYVSFKYNLSFEDLTTDFKEFVEEEKVKLSKSNLSDDYKTYMDNHEEELQKKFDIKHSFQTNTRSVKIRGVYPSQEEANLRCKLLRELDPVHDIHVGEVGMWLLWDPEAYKTGRVEYMDDELNQLMHEKQKNETNAKSSFDQRVKDAKREAIEENIKKAQLSNNTLSQTIDENGNLIGVNNSGSSQESALGEKEVVTSADVCKELFEGANVVIGKSDNGQSQLKSGPFASL
jgi:hypothetical protein